jgi:hypothetical protein
MSRLPFTPDSLIAISTDNNNQHTHTLSNNSQITISFPTFMSPETVPAPVGYQRFQSAHNTLESEIVLSYYIEGFPCMLYIQDTSQSNPLDPLKSHLSEKMPTLLSKLYHDLVVNRDEGSVNQLMQAALTEIKQSIDSINIQSNIVPAATLTIGYPKYSHDVPKRESNEYTLHLASKGMSDAHIALRYEKHDGAFQQLSLAPKIIMVNHGIPRAATLLDTLSRAQTISKALPRDAKQDGKHSLVMISGGISDYFHKEKKADTNQASITPEITTLTMNPAVDPHTLLTDQINKRNYPTSNGLFCWMQFPTCEQRKYFTTKKPYNAKWFSILMANKKFRQSIHPSTQNEIKTLDALNYQIEAIKQAPTTQQKINSTLMLLLDYDFDSENRKIIALAKNIILSQADIITLFDTIHNTYLDPSKPSKWSFLFCISRESIETQLERLEGVAEKCFSFNRTRTMEKVTLIQTALNRLGKDPYITHQQYQAGGSDSLESSLSFNRDFLSSLFSQAASAHHDVVTQFTQYSRLILNALQRALAINAETIAIGHGGEKFTDDSTKKHETYKSRDIIRILKSPTDGTPIKKDHTTEHYNSFAHTIGFT